MALSTKNVSVDVKQYTPAERKELIARLREYHQEYFNLIEESDAVYIAKMKYGFPPDRAKFFPNEINSTRPLYVEWVSRDYKPEDDRNLYKYEFNPNFNTEYIKVDMPGGAEMYEVPASRFKLVKKGIVDKEEQLQIPFESPEFQIMDPGEDVPLKDITLRDITAILLKSPVSRKEWLNDLIKKTCQK